MEKTVLKPEQRGAGKWNAAVLDSIVQCSDPDFVEFLAQMFFFDWWENDR